MSKIGGVLRRHFLAVQLFVLGMVVTGSAIYTSTAAACGGEEEPACGLADSFNPASTASELLTKLGPVGVAVVSIFVAVFLFSVGLHFFRRNGKSVAK